MATPEQNAWVTRVLGVSVGPVVAEAQKSRLAAVGEDLKRVPGAATLTDEFRHAVALARAGDADADIVIDELEDRVADLAANARAAQIAVELRRARPSKSGFVAIAKARLAWSEILADAREAASNAVDGATALLATAEFAEDPRADLPETAAAIAGLPGRIAALDDVTEAVNAALDGSGTDRPALLKAAVAAIDAHIVKLRGDVFFRALEEAAPGYPTISLLEDALRRMRDVLGQGGEEAASMKDAA